MKKKYLLASGPTPVPENVSLEMALPMQHHRTLQFSKISGEADVFIFAATGTAGDIS